jgi:hypothetical protein
LQATGVWQELPAKMSKHHVQSSKPEHWLQLLLYELQSYQIFSLEKKDLTVIIEQLRSTVKVWLAVVKDCQGSSSRVTSTWRYTLQSIVCDICLVGGNIEMHCKLSQDTFGRGDDIVELALEVVTIWWIKQ